MKVSTRLLFAISIAVINNQYAVAEIPPTVNLEAGISIYNGHIVYPVPESDYANIIEVGPGYQFEEIHDITYSSLTENTLVKIHYRTEPYHTKTRLATGGTENGHLRIQGIPDANGNLPVITAENATLFGEFDQYNQDLGVFIVQGPYGSKPAWIEFVNLHIKDGEYAGIWAKADHVSIKGCILENNPNGIFFQATNQVIEEISTYNLIEGCRFIDNGRIDSWYQHNIYSQGYHTIIQLNTIGNLQDGALGSSLKDRSAHTVVRYNYIETSARTIDLVEPEDTDEILMADDDWDDAYVYGNLIVNEMLPYEDAGGNMIHYGFDNTPEITRAGTLFFANNTVIIIRNDNPWRINLFDVNSVTTSVNYINNITVATGMENFNIFRSTENSNAGHINFSGTSWFTNGWQLTETEGLPESDYSMAGEENIINGTDPGFTNAEQHNYTLTENSVCSNAGEDISVLPAFNLLVDYNPITNNNIELRTDKANPDLGCFSSSGETLSVDNITNSTKYTSYNYPNPVYTNTTITYNIPELSNCALSIYNSSGQLVKKLIDKTQPKGTYTVEWDGTDDNNTKVASGIYYGSVKTKSSAESFKMIVVN